MKESATIQYDPAMNGSIHFKCACIHCGGRIEAPVSLSGIEIECPHCSRPTNLNHRREQAQSEPLTLAPDPPSPPRPPSPPTRPTRHNPTRVNSDAAARRRQDEIVSRGLRVAKYVGLIALIGIWYLGYPTVSRVMDGEEASALDGIILTVSVLTALFAGSVLFFWIYRTFFGWVTGVGSEGVGGFHHGGCGGGCGGGGCGGCGSG